MLMVIKKENKKQKGKIMKKNFTKEDLRKAIEKRFEDIDLQLYGSLEEALLEEISMMKDTLEDEKDIEREQVMTDLSQIFKNQCIFLHEMLDSGILGEGAIITRKEIQHITTIAKGISYLGEAFETLYKFID